MKMIDDVLAEFDFGRVHEYMESVDWKWAFDDGEMRVPGIGRLYQVSERLLAAVMERGGGISATGGFYASYQKYDSGDGELSLSFQIAEHSVMDSDYGKE